MTEPQRPGRRDWAFETAAGRRIPPVHQGPQFSLERHRAHFHDLHKFFESQYEELDDKIDEIAEFIRSLGEKSPGSMAEFLKTTRLKEAGAESIKAHEMAGDLLADHESIVRQLRGDVERAGSEFHAADVADFLTGLVEDHQRITWMLRSITE